MGKWLHFVPENIPAVQAQTVIMFIFLFLFFFISFISVLFCLFMLSSSSLSVLLFLLVFDCLVSVITISDRPLQKPNCGLFVTTWRSEGTFILCRFRIDTFVYTYTGLNQKKINNSLLVLNCPTKKVHRRFRIPWSVIPNFPTSQFENPDMVIHDDIWPKRINFHFPWFDGSLQGWFLLD